MAAPPPAPLDAPWPEPPAIKVVASIVFWMTRALLRTAPELDEDEEEEGKVTEPKSSSPGSSTFATALELAPCWMRRDDLMATVVVTLVSGSDSDLITGAVAISSESFRGEFEDVATDAFVIVVIVELLSFLFRCRCLGSCVDGPLSKLRFFPSNLLLNSVVSTGGDDLVLFQHHCSMIIRDCPEDIRQGSEDFLAKINRDSHGPESRS